MEETIVSIKNLSHKYSVQWAIKDISFDIKERGVMGLLGSNGAGKSTTMNIICGVINQTEGEVYINNISLRENPVEAKKYIGFLPQQPPLYTDLTVEEYLTHCAHLRLMPPAEVKEAVELALEKCSITHFRDRLIKNLSGGYQQRVGIAQAIVHNPKFVVLDEPTNGLDPNQIVDIRNLIRDIAKYHSVLLSTHILSEVQAICSEIKMIEDGKLVFSGTMEEFDNFIVPTSFTIEMANPPAVSEFEELFNIKMIEEVNSTTARYSFSDNIDITKDIITQSVKRGWKLKDLRVERSTLDEVFAQLSGKNINKK